ncbi:MAG: DUF4405 domain-containing protein [Pyrobaculum sp.]
MPSYANRNILYWFGDVAVISFVVLCISGYLLLMSYSPSPQLIEWRGSTAPEAYVSIYQTITQRPLGYLLRQIHVWAAYVMLTSALLHLLAKIYTKAFKKTPWLTGTTLGGVVYLQILLGHGLTLGQWGGAVVNAFVKGGEVETFMKIAAALHMIFIPAAIILLIVAKVGYVLKHGVTPPPRARGWGEELFYPHRVWLLAAAFCLTLWTILTLASSIEFPLGEPWRPGDNYSMPLLPQATPGAFVLLTIATAAALPFIKHTFFKILTGGTATTSAMLFLTTELSPAPPLYIFLNAAALPVLIFKKHYAAALSLVLIYLIIESIQADLTNAEVQKALATKLSTLSLTWGLYAVVKYRSMK